MSAKVSVVVPVYKVEKYLNACVSSLVNQTLKEMEIILVDDGSSDNCPQMCDNWALRDKRIKVVHQKNRGLSAARNVGVSVASGTYLAFVDSDDTVMPQMYERLLKTAEEKQADVVFCGLQRVNVAHVPKMKETAISPELLTTESALVLGLTGKMPLYGWNFLVKLSDWNHLPLKFDETLCFQEDAELVFRMIANAEKIAYLPEPLYCYWRHGGAMTVAPKLQYVAAIPVLLKKIKLTLKGSKDSVCRALSVYEVSEYTFAYHLYLCSKEPNKPKQLRAEVLTDLREGVRRCPFHDWRKNSNALETLLSVLHLLPLAVWVRYGRKD